MQPQNTLIWWEDKPVDDKDYQKLRNKLFYAKTSGTQTSSRYWFWCCCFVLLLPVCASELLCCSNKRYCHVWSDRHR